MTYGRKTGGRQKGVRNKTVMARLAAEGDTSQELPLDYMLRVMRDKNISETRRDAMAKAAAPYLHPRLDSAPAGFRLQETLAGPDGKGRMLEIEFVLPANGPTDDASD